MKLAANEHLGSAHRIGPVYRVTFEAIGATFSVDCDAAQGPDFPLPETSEVIVRVSAADWSPTLIITPNLGVVIASCPSNRLFYVERVP